jgi:hypothetical protein
MFLFPMQIENLDVSDYLEIMGQFENVSQQQPAETQWVPSLLPTNTTIEPLHAMAAITPHTAEHASDPSLYNSTFGTPSGIASPSTASHTQEQQQIRNVSPGMVSNITFGSLIK